MKRAIIIFIVLTLINPPLWATQSLSPVMEDWADEKADNVLAIAPLLYALRSEKEPATIKEIKSQIEKELRVINAVPYWNTLVFNPDNSIEIVIDYRVKDRSNLVINRFKQISDNEYYVEVIRDEPRVNNGIARGALGLKLSRALVPAQVLEQVEQVGLPQAQRYVEETLLTESPQAFAYRNAVTEEEPVQEVLGVIKQVRERIGAPIKAVVVLGIGGQSLGNRAVVQMLGSQEIKFIFPDNITNPTRWLAELEGIKPENVLLYVSSKTGSTDETMANFWFFWEWMINKLGQPRVASALLEKLQGVNLAEVKLSELNLSRREKNLLQATLNRIVVSTTPEKQGPIYNFAVNNNIPIVPLQAPIEEGYTVLFRSGQFTTALAGYDIERMRQAVSPFASAFNEDNPELNPALETAMYAYAAYKSGLPILAAVSSNTKLVPLFEWARQLVNGSLGKEGKGPYLTFAAGKEASQSLTKAQKDKLFLVINVGEERLEIPKGVSAIEINIPEINQETLARVFLFIEEFTVRYGTLLGVNPVTQPWVDKFGEILTEKAKWFDISPEARQERQARAGAVKEFSTSGGLQVQEGLLAELTRNDELLATTTKAPENESEFQGLLSIGKYKLPGELEGIAQNLALQLYSAEKLGKSINPFFIYSASPEARLVGEFIKYLGQRRMEKLKGGILWDYLIGPTDHPTAQFLGAGNNIGITTFLHFLQEPGKNPPILMANGLIHERLNGKTPHEVNTLYLKAVREAINNEGKLTNTIEVPNEGRENLEKLYQLFVRISELYTRLWKHENKGGTTLGRLAEANESVVIEAEGGVVKAGGYGKEQSQETSSSWVSVLMRMSGIPVKGFIHPQVEGLSGEVANSVNKFIDRLSVLAKTIDMVVRKEGSALNRFVTAEELKEQVKPEFYVFRLEDAIAKVEIGNIVGDTLWEEIRIRAANTMIAKTIQEIKRVNPKARVIVYTENPQLTERRINAALNAIDSSGVFDMIVIGNAAKVLSELSNRGWVNALDEAMQKTVFASTEKIENARTVIVPNERFTPFPELAFVMQTMLRNQKLDVDNIIASYTVWLELAGLSDKEIEDFKRKLRESLKIGTNLVVSLPLPPEPKPGSVMKQLDEEYEKSTNTKGFA